ncbi:MAG: glycerol-3-phosphate acyltransferase, partial [Nitrospinota bacterium]
MTLVSLLSYLILPALAYLLGSLSPAYLVGRLNGLDLRFEGSGHLGARNAGRVLGWKWGAGVLVADFLKGQLAVVLPWLLTESPILSSICAIAVVAGHNWSVFLEFSGGKGLTPAAGALFML